MKRLAVLITLLFLLSPSLARAQGNGTIEIDPTDNPLVITGWVDQANDFSGALRMVAHGDNVQGFTILATDLKNEGGTATISRQNVHVAGELSLLKEIPKDFQVTVTKPALPGSYQGQLLILLPGKELKDAIKVDLRLAAKQHALVKTVAGADQAQLNLVTCSQGLDCWLAGIILPGSAFLNQWPIYLENQGALPATLVSGDIIARGEKTNFPLTGTQLGMSLNGQPIPARSIGTTQLQIGRLDIPPDHYSGTIYVRVQDKDEFLQIPLNLNVRGSALLATLLLLLGIVLGRLVKYMQERGEPQAQALAGVNDLENEIQATSLKEKGALLAMAKALRERVYDEKLTDVDAQTNAVRARLEAIQKLDAIQAAIKDKLQNPVARKASDLADQARSLFSLSQDDQGKALLPEIQKNLNALSQATMGSGNQPDPDVTRALSNAGDAASAMVKVSGQVLAPTRPDIGQWIRNALLALTGFEKQARAEATLWLVRPLLFLVLLIGLLALGLSTLYVQQSATFGAQPFTDYFALVFWGLSADVASRSLSNLQPTANR